MATNPNTPNQLAARRPVWLATEHANEPFLHFTDGECDCYRCKAEAITLISLIQ